MISLLKNSLRSKYLFLKNYNVFRAFLKRSNLNIENNQVKSELFAILLSPWSLNTTPWFSITLGLILYKRGHKITFIIDDKQFENKINHLIQVKLIKSCLSILDEKKMKIEYLSNHYSNDKPEESELIAISNLAYANTVHKNRGEEDSIDFKNNCIANEVILERNFSFVKSFIQKNLKHRFIVPGGIYGNSGLFEFILKAKNMEYFTFDSGFSVLLSTYKGIAAQFTDIPRSLDLLMKEERSHQDYAVAFAKEEIEKRKNGTNKLNSQYQSFEESESFKEVGILIPLNSPWDSAALNIASVFKGYNEWLLETIELILNNSNYNITIRQHPDERFWWGKTKTDFLELINVRYRNERIQFVSCYDKVNSYALLKDCKGVICYSSTFGIESVMSGKSVCVCSNVYYSNLGFSYKPNNTGDIVSFVKRLSKTVQPGNLDKAAMTYYLGQHCNWLFTVFTPMTTDFEKWTELGIEKLMVEPNVKIYLESLEKLLPISYVNHKSNHDTN